MDMNRVKGTVDEVAGAAKETAGKLTGDNQLQVKGIAQQLKGKAENALGKTKDAFRAGSKRRGM